MDDKSKAEVKPKFDFSRVSRQWNNELTRSLTQAARVQLVLQRQPNDDMSDDDVDALFDRQERALDELEALAETQAALLVQVLAEVPTSWLLPNAPDDLDWSKVESLDFVQADRYAEMLNLLRTKDVPTDDAKNSDGHSRSRRKRRGQ